MRVLVSIPVHEDADVVRQQIGNLERFLVDPLVVLHVSRGFDVDPSTLASSPRVLINPRRYATGWSSGSCAEAHLSNLEYACEQGAFDYAVLASSNELYVRRGLEDHISHHLVGTNPGRFERWPLPR